MAKPRPQQPEVHYVWAETDTARVHIDTIKARRKDLFGFTYYSDQEYRDFIEKRVGERIKEVRFDTHPPKKTFRPESFFEINLLFRTFAETTREEVIDFILSSILGYVDHIRETYPQLVRLENKVEIQSVSDYKKVLRDE